MGERSGDHALQVKPTALEQRVAGGRKRWGRLKAEVGRNIGGFVAR